MKIKILLYYYFLACNSVLTFKLIPERFQIPIDNKEEEELYKIFLNFKKMELLKNLKNNKLNTLQKMEKINIFNKNYEEHIICHNITKGGLLDDWDFEIN